MRRRLLPVVTLLAGWNLLSAQSLPDRKETLKALVKVGSYFTKKYANFARPSYVGELRLNNIWTRGVCHGGLMALHTVYLRSDYYDYTYDWVDLRKQGLRGDNITRDADGHCCGQACIELYKISPDPTKVRSIKVSIDMLVNTPQVDGWTQIDAVQMGMPVLAQLDRLIGEQKYYSKVWQMYSCSHNEIGNGPSNQKERPWWRGANFALPYRKSNGKNCFWSRGNEWVYATLVRILNEAPKNDTHCMDYIRDFLSMNKALKTCQRVDGFWNVSLHDESNYGGKETPRTSLFVCGVVWGVRNGLLDKKEYIPVIVKARNAIVKEAIYPDDFLGLVQSSGKEPKNSQPVTYKGVPDFEGYGIGCFLLAGTEVYKID